MAITINNTEKPSGKSFQNIWIVVEADGDKCNFVHSAPADLDGDDLQAYVDGREDFYKRELLRNMYPTADCYDSGLEDWEKWIADGRVNPEITEERITQAAVEAKPATMGERQVVVLSEVEEEVSKTEIVEVDGKYVEQTTTETVTNTVSEPQFTEHPLYNEDGTPQTRVVTPAVEAVEGVEAVEATYFEEGDELPEGKAVGDIKTEAVEGSEAVEAVAEVREPVLHSVPTMESYTISEATEAVAEQSETIITRPETVVEKVAWKDTSE